MEDVDSVAQDEGNLPLTNNDELDMPLIDGKEE